VDHTRVWLASFAMVPLCPPAHSPAPPPLRLAAGTNLHRDARAVPLHSTQHTARSPHTLLAPLFLRSTVPSLPARCARGSYPGPCAAFAVADDAATPSHTGQDAGVLADDRVLVMRGKHQGHNSIESWRDVGWYRTVLRLRTRQKKRRCALSARLVQPASKKGTIGGAGDEGTERGERR
jgi:hypothetical protein